MTVVADLFIMIPGYLVTVKVKRVAALLFKTIVYWRVVTPLLNIFFTWAAFILNIPSANVYISVAKVQVTPALFKKVTDLMPVVIRLPEPKSILTRTG